MSTKLFDIEKQLKRFLSSPSGSEQLAETNGLSGISIIEAHVQKRWLDAGQVLARNLENGKVNCLNIINVGVAERNRRKGLFKDFLELLEGVDYSAYFDECDCFYLRIDKVMNPILDDFLPRRGYTRTKSENETHYSYHKMVQAICPADHKYPDQSVSTYMYA